MLRFIKPDKWIIICMCVCEFAILRRTVGFGTSDDSELLRRMEMRMIPIQQQYVNDNITEEQLLQNCVMSEESLQESVG